MINFKWRIFSAVCCAVLAFGVAVLYLRLTGQW